MGWKLRELLFQCNWERDNCWITANREINMSQQIKWTLYFTETGIKKHTQALCSGLNSNHVHQTFLSLKNIFKSNYRLGSRTEMYHICFLPDCTAAGVESWNVLICQRVARSVKVPAIYPDQRLKTKRTECTERRGAEWTDLWCVCGGRGEAGASQKRNGTEPTVVRIALMWIVATIWQGRHRLLHITFCHLTLPCWLWSKKKKNKKKGKKIPRRIYWI